MIKAIMKPHFIANWKKTTSENMKRPGICVVRSINCGGMERGRDKGHG